MRYLSVFCVSFLLALAAGDVGAQGKTVVIDHNNPAHSARLHVGDTLIIKLRVNAVTTYKWVPGNVNAQVLTLLGSTNHPVKPGVLGGPVDQIFRFQGAGVGNTTATFTLMHQASGIKVIAEHYRCRVRVTQAAKSEHAGAKSH